MNDKFQRHPVYSSEENIGFFLDSIRCTQPTYVLPAEYCAVSDYKFTCENKTFQHDNVMSALSLSHPKVT